MKKLNKIYFLATGVFVISLVIFVLIFFLNSSFVLEKKEIPIFLMVGEPAGFNTNTDSLDFGRIIYGGSAERSILIENNYNFPIQIKFNIEGNVSDFIIFEKVVFLEKGESKRIIFGTIVFSDEEYGDYSGRLLVKIEKDI